LVQGIEDEDHPALRRGHVEPVGEGGPEVIGLVGDLLLDFEVAFQLAQDPPEHGGPVGAVGRGPDEMQEDDRLPGGRGRGTEPTHETAPHRCVGRLWCLRGAATGLKRPVGEEGRLADTGVAEDDERGAVAGRVLVKASEVFLAADVDPGATLGEGFVLGGLPGEGGRDGFLGEEAVNDRGEVLEDELAEGLGIGVGLADGEAALADARLEGLELLPADLGAAGGLPFPIAGDLFRGGDFAEVGLLVGRKSVQVARVSEVEEGVVGHLRVVQDPVEDLQLGDGVLEVLLKPSLPFDEVLRDFVRHPPIPLPQEADEVRPAALDLGQADGEDLPLRFLLVRDPPAEVHLPPRHAA